MTEPDLVIFDCDGVLVDSEVIAAQVEAELITAAGYAISAEELSELYSGLTFKDILLSIEAKSKVPFKAALIDQVESLIDERLASDVQAIEGAAEAVAGVVAPRCICSNSTQERLALMLSRTGLKNLFEGRIFSAFDTPSRKPKPASDVFLFAAEAMRARPEATFVIEDSIHGVHGARAAGMRVIGFTGAAHSYAGHADALTEAGAETVIRRWADLKSVLAALAEWAE